MFSLILIVLQTQMKKVNSSQLKIHTIWDSSAIAVWKSWDSLDSTGIAIGFALLCAWFSSEGAEGIHVN